MSTPGLTELRIGAFKSHRQQRLAIEPMTLLIGANGSGKSNALDALSLLALLADGRDVSDLERGDQEVAGLRGGLSGAAPFGDEQIAVGCTVDVGDGSTLHLDIELDASTRPEIVTERLTLRNRGGNKRDLDLVVSTRQRPDAGISDAQVYSGGAPKTYNFLSTRLAVSQALTKVPEDSNWRRTVVQHCGRVVGALRGVFVLDPVPGQMREYVRIGSSLDRSASTLSAVVYRLREHPNSWKRLNDLVQGLLAVRVEEVVFSEGRLPDDRLADVMVALVERVGDRGFTAPARVMSDGTLRYLAIVASLLELRLAHSKEDGYQGTLVVEEIENSLFPSQAATVLDLLRTEARSGGVSLVATTHSPALLDALKPEDHAGVFICERRDDGLSVIQPLLDHPRYVDVAGGGAIGRAVTRGVLRPRGEAERSFSELFAS